MGRSEPTAAPAAPHHGNGDRMANGRRSTVVTTSQVRSARFRVARDRASGRDTPTRVQKIAEVRLPDDRDG